MADRPAPEVVVDIELVSELIADQHPDLADRTITFVERGWDNTNFRLGEDLLVRMPHREMAAELIDNEQRWLKELAPRLPLPTPTPVRSGVPAERYPWNWSITPWFDGDVAARAALEDPAADAVLLGQFFATLHQPLPIGGPVNPYRGGPVADRSVAFYKNLVTLDSAFDKDRIAAMFDHAANIEPGPERVWLHGDLHTRNMIVDQGKLAAVIDWGDICIGDAACDLVAAYMLVPDHVDLVKSHAGASAQGWQRARGWAAHFGVMYWAFGDDDPVMTKIGTDLLTTLLRDD